MGCIMLCIKAANRYAKPDRVLIGDIGLCLGANVYAKRLLKEAEDTKRRGREMLHSFVPPKVLEKIEAYWDVDSEEYKARTKGSRNSAASSSEGSSLTASGSVESTQSSTSNSGCGGRNSRPRSNSWYIAQSDWTDADIGKGTARSMGQSGVEENIRLLKNMNGGSNPEDDDVGVIVSTSGMDFAPTLRALYAECVENGELL